MSLWVGSAGEFENRGCGHRYADAMWNDGLRCLVARVLITLVLAADGVAHAMAEMDSGVAKTDASQGCCEEHLGLGFSIVRVTDCAGEIFDGGSEGVQGKDVGNGIGALVGRPGDGVRGTWDALVVGNCGPGF